ncbi:MAG: DUF4382 domain-containing protein [Halioglobus sp.]
MMKQMLVRTMLLALLIPALLSLSGCPCGFDCSSDNDIAPGVLSLGISDASVEELKQVVIEIDQITLRRTGTVDIVIDSFTIEALGLTEVDSFQVDLLDYRGRNQLLVIQELELTRGTYTEVLLEAKDEDINFSFVEESDGSLNVLNVSSGGLSLPGFEISSGSQQYTIEIGLAQALEYDQDSETYLLTDNGVRVENNATAASLSGRVDSSLFDSASGCDSKIDPLAGNRIYIYSGAALADNALADVFRSGGNTTVPDYAQAPYAVAALIENVLTAGWDYAFGFLPAGDYTLAFACDAAEDDPINYDGIVVPQPLDQRYEINLSEAELAVCDLSDGASCS